MIPNKYYILNALIMSRGTHSIKTLVLMNDEINRQMKDLIHIEKLEEKNGQA
jgi:hypothetical protein